LEGAVYLEDEWQITPRLHANIGLRASLWQADEKTYYNLQPRLAATYDLQPNIQLKASYSYMSQYLHLLTTTGIGLPNDLWVPTTDRVAPQDSWQIVAGVEYRRNKFFDLSIEGYFKKLNNVITYQEGSSLTSIDAENWENNVTTGEGWAYGLEIFVDKNFGRTTGWLSYTLAWSLRQFDRVNLGQTFPFRYDRRHNLKLVLIHRLGSNWELSGNWVYGTGLATTLPISEYQASIPGFSGRSELAINFGEKNSFRLPNYHRLDIGANYSFGKNTKSHTLSFGFYNIYNRRNPLYYRLSRGTRNPLNPRGKQYIEVSLLPITPYFSYSIEF
ncbi:MAG: TonB-dependent receptor, partial [Bacteroidota bacterium]